MSGKRKTEADQLIHSMTSSRFHYVNGLTKREYFAGLAMQGAISRAGSTNNLEDIASYSVKIADTLIEELNKEPV